MLIKVATEGKNTQTAIFYAGIFTGTVVTSNLAHMAHISAPQIGNKTT